jgi:hypothetical protein
MLSDGFLKSFAALQADIQHIKPMHNASIPTAKGGTIKYDYADLHDIWKDVKPLVAAHGFTITQRPVVVEGKEVLTTDLIHIETSDVMSTSIFIPGSNDMRQRGAHISYLRRYCICSMLMITISGEDREERLGDGESKRRSPTINNKLRIEKYRSEILACKGRAARKAWWNKNIADIDDAGQDVRDAVESYLSQAAANEQGDLV